MPEMSDYVTKTDLQFALDGAVQTIITEMGIRFGEVNQRLDRIDATLVNHGKQIGAWTPRTVEPGGLNGERAGTMTDTQLYLSIGIPALLALMNMAVMLTLFTTLSNRIQRVEERLDNLIGAVNELDKRLTKVEIKLGIQP
jgi:hypothetical protein